jgi:hypothetical protein
MISLDSYGKFQEWLKNDWFPNNPMAVQLDGQTIAVPNRAVKVTFLIQEIPNLTGRVSLHGDTTVEALKIFADSPIEDFIIVPPQKGDSFVNWRFHHKSIHNYNHDASADGMFAYIK